MKSEEIEKNSPWVPTKKFFSEVLLVAVLTAVGYLGAFAYQYDFLNYFGIPVYFVDINLGLILLTALFGSLWIAFIGLILNRLITWKLNRKIQALMVWIFLYICFVFPLFAIGFDPNQPIRTILNFLGALVVLVISGMDLYKMTPRQDVPSSLLFRLEQLYGSFPVIFIVILISFILYCGVGGVLIGKYQSNYLVTNTMPQRAVISTYNGSLITIQFSTSTIPHSFQNDIVLFDQDKLSNSNIVFTNEKIGPLFPTN